MLSLSRISRLEKWRCLAHQFHWHKIRRWITDDEYDKFYQSFREQIADIDTRLGMLQEAEDNYYITAKYLLELANRAYDLFVSSELEEKRQLIKLVLQNLRLEGKTVRYTALKPFDAILNCSDRQLWLPNPQIIRTNTEKVLRAFENVIQTELIRVRWEEIKRFNLTQTECLEVR